MLAVVDGIELYAEIGVPSESDEEYGYDLKAEIFRKFLRGAPSRSGKSDTVV